MDATSPNPVQSPVIKLKCVKPKLNVNEAVLRCMGERVDLFPFVFF